MSNRKKNNEPRDGHVILRLLACASPEQKRQIFEEEAEKAFYALQNLVLMSQKFGPDKLLAAHAELQEDQLGDLLGCVDDAKLLERWVRESLKSA
jgi:hypothetical protein